MKNIKSILLVITFIFILIPNTVFGQIEGKKVLIRPNADNGPTEVEVGIWLLDIDSIDSSAQSFVANIFIVLRWNDPSLASQENGYVTYELKNIWNPKLELLNEIGIVRKTMPEIVTVDEDGTVYYRQRFVGPFSQPLNLKNFPFDQNTFNLHFASAGMRIAEIKFIRNKDWIKDGLPKAGGISPDISLPDWKIISFDTGAKPYTLAPKMQVAGYIFEFLAKRDIMHYIWKVFLPLLIIVIMSWSVFWIDPSNSGTQIGVATTSMLTLIAYRFAIDSQVPKVPYMTKLDQFVVMGTVLIFLALAQVVFTSWLAYTGKQEQARKIDRISRYCFPVTFIIALSISLIL